MRHVALLAALVILGSVVAGATVAAADQPVASSVATAPVDSTMSTGPTAPAVSPHSMQSAIAPEGSRLVLSVGAPRTNFTISLRDDGSARWTIETRIPLTDEADREAFQEYGRSYENGNAVGGPTVDPFRNAARAAENATEREMSVGQVNRTATVQNGSGVLRLTFTWSAFLETGEDGALVLGDAFRTPHNGTWFGSLSPSQRLVIEPPAEYEVSDVSQGFSYSISDRRIVADGPQTFESNDIQIRYEPGGPTEESPLSIELIVVAGLILLFVVAVVAYRRGGIRSEPAATRGEGAGTDGGSAAAEGAEAGGPDTEATGGEEPSTPTAPQPASSGAEPNGEAPAEPSEEELELLSDEERVERLLAREGGRMRQANIVSETGWSDAKVSQLLSAMAEEGRVEKLRLGRENLISLAETDEGDAGEEADDEAGDAANE